VDPGQAETLLRRTFHEATIRSDHRLASSMAGDLVSLLRDQGRLREALTLAEQTIEHTHQAGLGLWNQRPSSPRHKPACCKAEPAGSLTPGRVPRPPRFR